MPNEKLIFDVAVDPKGFRDAANNMSRELSKSAQAWSKEVRHLFGGAVKDGFQHAMASGKSGKAIGAFLKTNITQVYSDFQKALRDGNAVAAQKYNDILEKRTRIFSNELEAMTRASERILDRQDQSFAQRTDGFGKALNNLGRGGAGGLFDALRGVGSRISDAGLNRQKRGAELHEKSRTMATKDVAGMEKGAKDAKFGKQLATIGKAAMGLAAVAGTLLIMVKLFIDLEKRVKDMNKAIMDGAGAADFGLTPINLGLGGLEERLKTIRDDTTNLHKFNSTAKEQQNILASFNQAGYSYARMNEEIKKGSKYMQSFSDVTAVALTYSRNLGVESGKIAQDMGSFAFATGQSLEEVAQSFSVIQREAMVSGFMTKRFYSAIVEATSGMSFYGVRIGETTALLKNFDSLLGEAAGTEMFQKMAREGGKDFQSSLKDFLILGPEIAKQQMNTVYQQKRAELEVQLGDDLQGTSLESLITETGGGSTLAKRLEEMGIGGQKGTDVMGLSLLQKASSKEGDTADLMRARAVAGPAFETVMKLRGPAGITGGESIGEAFHKGNEGVIIMLQSLANSQNISMNELITIDQKNSGRFALLQDIATGSTKMTEELTKMGFFIANAGTKDAKIMRGVMDENGHLVANSGVEMKDKFDLILTRPTEDGKELKKQLTKDQEIASEISKHVTGISDTIEQLTNSILERIYGGIMSIAGFLASDTEKERQLASLKATHEAQKKAEEEAKGASEKAAKAQEDLNKAKQGGDPKVVAEAEAKATKAQADAAHKRDLAQRADRAKAATEGLSNEDRKSADMGYSKVLEAQGGVGEDRAKTLESSVGRILDRKKTKFGYTGDKEMTAKNLGHDAYEYAVGSTMDVWGGADAMAEHTSEKFAEEGTAANIRGGYQGTEEIIEAAKKAYIDAGGGTLNAFRKPEVERAAGEAYNQTITSKLGELTKTDEEMAKDTQESTQLMKDILLKAHTLFGQTPTKANDLIIPAGGGRPILTSPQDTLMAFKPGGPISAGMGAGAGGGAPVTVNIYGGDEQKVYNQVMRVMKTLGHA